MSENLFQCPHRGHRCYFKMIITPGSKSGTQISTSPRIERTLMGKRAARIHLAHGSLQNFTPEAVGLNSGSRTQSCTLPSIFFTLQGEKVNLFVSIYNESFWGTKSKEWFSSVSISQASCTKISMNLISIRFSPVMSTFIASFPTNLLKSTPCKREKTLLYIPSAGQVSYHMDTCNGEHPWSIWILIN